MRKLVCMFVLCIIMISSLGAIMSINDVTRTMGFRTRLTGGQNRLEYSPALSTVKVVVPYPDDVTSVSYTTANVDFKNNMIATTTTPILPDGVEIHFVNVTPTDGWSDPVVIAKITPDHLNSSMNVRIEPTKSYTWGINIEPFSNGDPDIRYSQKNITLKAKAKMVYYCGATECTPAELNKNAVGDINMVFEIVMVGKYKYGPYQISGLVRGKETTIAGRTFQIMDAADGSSVYLRVGSEVYDVAISTEEGQVFLDSKMAVKAKTVLIPDYNDPTKDKISLEIFSETQLEGLEYSTDISEYQYSGEIVWGKPDNAALTGTGALRTIRIECFEPLDVQIPFKFEGSEGRNIYIKWNQGIDEFSDPQLKNSYVDPNDPYYKENYVTIRADASAMTRNSAPKSDLLEIWDYDSDIVISRIRVEIARIQGPIEIIPITKAYVGQEMQISINEGSFPVDAGRISKISYRYGTQNPVDACNGVGTCTNPLVITPTSVGELRVSARVDNDTFNSRSIPITNPPPEYDIEGSLEVMAGSTTEYRIYDKNSLNDAGAGVVNSILITDPAGNPFLRDKGARVTFNPSTQGSYQLQVDFTNTQISPISKTITVKPKVVEFTPTRIGETIKITMAEPNQGTVTFTDTVGTTYYGGEGVVGERTFTGFPDGTTITISVSAQGYAANSKEVTFPAKPVVGLNLNFEKSSNKLVGDYTPSDAKVTLYYEPTGRPDQRETVTSNFQGGSIVWAKPKNGSYILTGIKDGYKDNSVRVDVTGASFFNDIGSINPLFIAIPLAALALIGGFVYLSRSGKLENLRFRKGDKGDQDFGDYEEYADDYPREAGGQEEMEYAQEPPPSQPDSDVAKMIIQARRKGKMSK